MITTTLAMALTIGGYINSSSRFHPDVLLAEPRYYPANVTDSVHRPGFNGRHFRSRPIIGPGEGPYISTYSIRQDRYGAYGEHAYVPVLSGLNRIEIDAFSPIGEAGFERFEAARNHWLRRHGYVGGVRTFTNDAYDYHAQGMHADLPQPRLKMRVPENAGRKPILRVDADTRFSWPPHAPAHVQTFRSGAGDDAIADRR